MLKKICKLFRSKEKGFTLIELLVVVAILGVLAAVAIPNVAKFVKSGTVAAANTEVATVQLAAAAYAADKQNDPLFVGNFYAGQPAGTGAYVAALATYLDKNLKGYYIFDMTGKLLDSTALPAVANPLYPGLTWSPDTKQFIQ